MLSWILATALSLQSSPVVQSIDAPPEPDQILSLPQELRDAVHEHVDGTPGSPQDRLHRLVQFMSKPDGLGVEYQGDATYTVSQIFRTRKANCLAFTLLTIALAREIGFPAYGRQIDRILSWDLSGQLVIQNTHANAGVMADGKPYVIDVATSEPLAATLPKRIDDKRLFALFYNNRAMELMVAGQAQNAHVWLDKAMQYDTGDASLWSNAGVLELRTGDPIGAERLFLEAISKNPHHSASLSNLVSYYERNGQTAQAAQWKKRADRSLRSDPFYQFLAGQEREQSGDYREAIRRYRRAIGLDRDEHIFHFGLARAYWRMGQLQQAVEEMTQAKRLSSDTKRARYQSKLDVLQRAQRQADTTRSHMLRY